MVLADTAHPSLAEATVLFERELQWDLEYNERCPCKALGEIAPVEFACQHWLKGESSRENTAGTNSGVGHKNLGRSILHLVEFQAKW
jgi:hypothetical protein